MPQASAVIPTYNCAKYIAEAVESVLAQTYQDFELIIVDDGSTDNTHQVLQPYMDRIRYFYQENQGESVARNLGIQMAQGKYVAFLDSDDLWLPTKLELQVATMDTFPDAVLVYSYCDIIDASGKRIAFRGSDLLGQGEPGLREVFDDLILVNLIANPGTVLVRRSSLADLIPFNPAIQWGEDWDLWLRLSLKGPVAFVPEVLASYRMREPGRRLQLEASDEFVHQNEAFLRKLFTLVSRERTDWQRLQSQAFGSLYLRSAIHNFEIDDVYRGTYYISQAIETGPEFIMNGPSFARRVAAEGVRIADECGEVLKGIAFVNRVFDHLPSGAENLQTYRSHALSQVHMAAAFAHFRMGQRFATWRHVVQAIREYPPNLQNRGLYSISAKVLVGGSRSTGANRPNP